MLLLHVIINYIRYSLDHGRVNFLCLFCKFCKFLNRKLYFPSYFLENTLLIICPSFVSSREDIWKFVVNIIIFFNNLNSTESLFRDNAALLNLATQTRRVNETIRYSNTSLSTYFTNKPAIYSQP